MLGGRSSGLQWALGWSQAWAFTSFIASILHSLDAWASQNTVYLVSKAGKSFELVNVPGEIKAGERLSLRGHKARGNSGSTFRVDHVSHDYGMCGS